MGRGPSKAGDALDGVFRRVGLEDVARSWRVVAAWAKAVGPQIAARSRAERVHEGVLYVRVPSSAWAQELGYLKASLLEKVRAEPGVGKVRDLRFSVGSLDEVPRPEATVDVPPPVGDGEPPAPPLPPLPEELSQALAELEDEELRELLARWITRVRRARGG